MRVELKKLLEKLGVNKELAPYETFPWLYYDEEKGITCSAEVRMGPGGSDLEAEIQFLNDDSGEEEEDGESQGGGTEQIMRLKAMPSADHQWSVKELKVRQEDYANKIHDWEGKGCNFFKACIQAIQMGGLPDIDDLIEKELDDDSFGGGKRGKIGRKSPKIKPAQLLGMKKPGGGM